MRILIVAMPFSIHTVRWVRHLNDLGMDVHLFSSMDYADLNPEFQGVTFHENVLDLKGGPIPSVRYVTCQKLFGWRPDSVMIRRIYGRLLRGLGLRKDRETQLRELVRRLRPDIIHTLESQHAGYLVSNVRETMKGDFPTWIHSTWGIDFHYFSRQEDHKSRIHTMLEGISGLVVEGKRDENLAKSLGYKGSVHCIPSVGGGFRFGGMPDVSLQDRNWILVKGNQDQIRRGLHALRALIQCGEHLQGYHIGIYSSCAETRELGRKMKHDYQMNVESLPAMSQEELFRLNSKARVNLTINLSDGVPNSMLEAMAMGALPIQSNTSMAEEWIDNGKNGFIVDPENIDSIAEAVREAVTNDRLFLDAAGYNMQMIRRVFDYDRMTGEINKLYKAYAS